MSLYIRFAVIIVCLLLLQTTFIPSISLGGFLPDLLMLFLVYFALQRGQIESTVCGFILGLLEDSISIKFFGLSALSKTVTGFVAGYFYNENTIGQTLGSYRYVLLVGLSSLIHNLLYFTLFFQGSEHSILVSVLTSSFGMTLYTCLIGILPMFYFSRKYDVSWTQ